MNPELTDALGSVTLTALHATCPQGAYMVDLLIARAIVEPHALLREERRLVDALSADGHFRALAALNNPDALNATELTRHFGSREVALKVMAALVTLRRANLLTLLNVHELMPDAFDRDWQPPSTARATEAAERGYLGLLDVNLDPDPTTTYGWQREG